MIYHLLYSADFSKAAGLWPEFAQNLGLDSILEFFPFYSGTLYAVFLH